MNLFPNLSPLWYSIPLLLLFTVQLIWLICCYAPVTRKDYALPDRRRARLAFVVLAVVYLPAVACLLSGLGLLPFGEGGTAVLFAAIDFWWLYPNSQSPAYREGTRRWPYHLLSAVAFAFALLGWLA